MRITPLHGRYLLIAAGAAFALWVLVGGLLKAAHHDALERASLASRTIARSLGEQQRSSLQAIDLSLQYLRDDWQRDPANFGRAVDRHADYLKRERVIQVAVVAADGSILFSRLPQSGPVSFADREYFQWHKAHPGDALHISEPLLGRVTRQWAIQFSRPLRGPQGEFEGLVVMALPPPALENLYKDFTLGATGVITLLRSDGAVLARTRDFAKAAGVHVETLRGARPNAAPSGDFRTRSPIDNVDRLVSYRNIDEFPVGVYVGQAYEDALSPYYDQRRLLLGGGLLGTLLIVAVALLLGSRARDRARYVEEREQLMLDLHDGCIQAIYAIGLSLQNVRRLVRQEPRRAADALAEAGASLNLVIQDLRAFIAGAPSRSLSDAEFIAEIDRLIPDLGERGPRFTVDIDRDVVSSLSPAQADHVLRIAREAVSNIVRHADATTAVLRLAASDGRVQLEMQDDGKGIEPGVSDRLGLGLHHIEARARKLHGNARVGPGPHGGTVVTVEFPQAA